MNSKKSSFSEEDQLMSQFFKALAHPARIQILKYLGQKKACVCGDIVEELPLAQSTVSQHLKELKSVGLIKGNIEGTAICYCIDVDQFEAMKKSITQLTDQIDALNQINCC